MIAASPIRPRTLAHHFTVFYPNLLSTLLQCPAPLLQAADFARLAACTCELIHGYVFSSPWRSRCDGSQPSFSRIKALSELRPRTPVGPEICLMDSFFPAMSMIIPAIWLMVTISSEPIF